jgi:hypothetical protein
VKLPGMLEEHSVCKFDVIQIEMGLTLWHKEIADPSFLASSGSGGRDYSSELADGTE